MLALSPDRPMIAEQLVEDAEETELAVGIEIDRDPWVATLIAAGYTVYAINRDGRPANTCHSNYY